MQEDCVWMVAVPTSAGQDTPNHRNQLNRNKMKRESAVFSECTSALVCGIYFFVLSDGDE